MEGFTDGLLQINECIYYICLHTSTFSCTPENEYLLHKKSLRTVSVHPVQNHIFCTSSTDWLVLL
jgi:hypothetical protein